MYAHDCWVTDLEFADDIVSMGEQPATVQLVLDQTVCEATAMVWM